MRMRKRKNLHKINRSAAATGQQSEEKPKTQNTENAPEGQESQDSNQTSKAQAEQQNQATQQGQDGQQYQQSQAMLEIENSQKTQKGQEAKTAQESQEMQAQSETSQNGASQDSASQGANQSNASQDGASQSNTSQGDTSQSNTTQNSASQGGGAQNNAAQGNASQSNGSQGSTSEGNASQSNDSQGASQGDTSQNNASQDSTSQDTAEGNASQNQTPQSAASQSNQTEGGSNHDSASSGNSGGVPNDGGPTSNGLEPAKQQQQGQQNQQNQQNQQQQQQQNQQSMQSQQNQQNQQFRQQPNTPNNPKAHATQETKSGQDPQLPPISKSLEQNVKFIKDSLGNSTDLIIRRFPFSPANDRLIAILFIDGLADSTIINDYIMEPLMQPEGGALAHLSEEKCDTSNVSQLIKDRALTFGDIHDLPDYNSLFHSLLSGDTILLVDGENTATAASVRGWRDRGVSETSSENVVRGSREGFSESLRTNTTLVRRRIKDPSLWMESMQIGHVSRTDVAIMYIKGIVNDQIVEEVHSRLSNINIDSILESGYIEELIQDETMTPFPTVYYSERPDVIAAELLEGKIAIFVDGTPIVLCVPAPFVSFMHAAEDYYQRADISSFIRLLRYVGILVSLLSPSFYIAVTTFHQEMIPTFLLISLASQREAVPFPAFFEALMMELTFEILREAGVRMPKYIGAAISIVGTLVIGQAAVQAGFISAAMVIVVSITAISSFVLPSYNMSIAFRMLRFPLMGLAASFGLVGIFVGCTIIILHLCSLRTFGVPYMTPLAPMIPVDNKDTLLRLPHRFMIRRPRLINQKNIQRQGPNSGPNPPKHR